MLPQYSLLLSSLQHLDCRAGCATATASVVTLLRAFPARAWTPQGRLGNCYFLAALSSCAEGEDDVLLKDLIIEEGMEQVCFRWLKRIESPEYDASLPSTGSAHPPSLSPLAG